MEIINKRVIIELKKNERKYFGKLIEIDDSPKQFSWIIIKENSGINQIIADSEILRMEVDE